MVLASLLALLSPLGTSGTGHSLSAGEPPEREVSRAQCAGPWERAANRARRLFLALCDAHSRCFAEEALFEQRLSADSFDHDHTATDAQHDDHDALYLYAFAQQ